MDRDDAINTGYGAAYLWCLRCDVGFARPWYGLPPDTTCWMCGKDDRIFYHHNVGGHMVFDRKEPK